MSTDRETMFQIPLQWSEYNGMSGDSAVLLSVYDGHGRKVSALFNRDLPFVNWRRRRVLRNLWLLWCHRYVGRLNVPDEHRVPWCVATA